MDTVLETFLSLTLNETLKRLSALPILKQNHSGGENVASGIASLILHFPGVSELRSCVKVEVSVGVKQQHFNQRKHSIYRAQELCESRGGRPGLPSLISLPFLWT